ncbi:hypothetical protein C7H84_33490 [Burkholderia sp. Nafp2/4-1b]|nr:hypothetical protein C7H84_33490 [Burkholderia sp. Nafp2/4-1b]
MQLWIPSDLGDAMVCEPPEYLVLTIRSLHQFSDRITAGPVSRSPETQHVTQHMNAIGFLCDRIQQ